MKKIEPTKDDIKEDEKKKSILKAYRIPMVGGASYYGVASPDGGTVAPSTGDGGGAE